MVGEEGDEYVERLEEENAKTTVLKIDWEKTKQKLDLCTIDKLNSIAIGRGIAKDSDKRALITNILLERSSRA